MNDKYVERIGLELETHARDAVTGHLVNTMTASALLRSEGTFGEYGTVKHDAGFDSAELITNPELSLERAVEALERLSDMLPWELSFSTHRPAKWGGSGVWSRDPRYDAMKEAVEQECDGDPRWEGIHAFTDWNSTHINISGEEIDPRKPTGLFLKNVLEHAVPAIAYNLRTECPESKGHLALWDGWCDSRRLPQYGEWYQDWNAYKEAFQKIPLLIRKDDDESWNPDLRRRQLLINAIAQGTNWKLVRIRKATEWYLEIRSIPSMRPEQIRSVGERLLSGVHALVQWHHRDHGKDRNVRTLDEAAPALRHAHDASDLFPSELLTEETWRTYFYS